MGRGASTRGAPVRNRVRGLVDLPAARVEDSPQNFRTHDARQREVMAGIFGAVGSVDELVVWVPDDGERERLRRMPGREGFDDWIRTFTGSVRLVNGHMRKRLRGKVLGCQVTDLDAAEAALVLATFDPIGAQAGRDEALLRDLLGGLATAPGSDLAGILAALHTLDAPAPGPDLDEDPPVDPTDEILAKWAALGCEAGSLWEVPSADGARVHRVLCGDARKAEDVARLMQGERAKLAEHDPPYGIAIVSHTGSTLGDGRPIAQRDGAGGHGNGARHPTPVTRRVPRGLFRPVEGDAKGQTTGNARSQLAPKGSFVAMVGDEASAKGRVVAPRKRRHEFEGATIGAQAPMVGDGSAPDVSHLLDSAERVVLWGANNFPASLPPSNTWIVWDKKATADGGSVASNSFSDAELAFVSLLPGETGHVRTIRHLWSGLVRASEKGDKRLAPTQKPIFVVAQPIAWWTKPGDIVCDWYCGSGGVGLACEKLGRVARLMEITPRYVAVTLERLSRAGLTPRRVG